MTNKIGSTCTVNDPQRGRILPLIPIFALGTLTGVAAAIVKAVNSAKSKEQLEETKRHNNTMQAIALGKGLYQAFFSIQQIEKQMNILLHRALINTVLIAFAKFFNIPHFRGVFMRDYLPKTVRKYGSTIVNLDSINGPGSHGLRTEKMNGE